MFPRTASGLGQTARGQTTQVEEFVGRLCWTDSGGAEQFKDLHYQPLYPARPQEGRLQNVGR